MRGLVAVRSLMRLLKLIVQVLAGLTGFLVMLGVEGCGDHLYSLAHEVTGAVDRCRLFCSVLGPLPSCPAR